MKRAVRRRGEACLALTLALALLLAGCGAKGQPNPAAEAPPATEVEREQDANMVQVDHPEQFPLVTASAHVSAPELNVTGVVGADVSQKRARDLAGFRARGGHSRTAGRHGRQGAAPDAGGERGRFRRVFRLPQSAGRRNSGARAARSLQAPVRQGSHRGQRPGSGRGHRRQGKGGCRNGTGASQGAGSGRRSSGLDSRYFRAHFGGDRGAERDRRRRASRPWTIRRTCSPSPICPASGSCATCTRTTWRMCVWANTRTSI